MRRVDAEGESRGVQGRKQIEARYRSRVRNANLEWLERRQLLTTSLSDLTSPTVTAAPPLISNEPNTSSVSFSTHTENLTANPSSSAPSVAVDPLNTKDMVAVWTNTDPTGYYGPGGNAVAPITSYAEGAYSTNGGLSWTSFPQADFGSASVNDQFDPSLTPPPGKVDYLTETTDASAAFDRNGNFYVLTDSHDAYPTGAVSGISSAGVLDIQRFTLSNAGVPVLQSRTPTAVYSWDQPDGGTSADPAVTPVLAVDNNQASFTDPTTGAVQADPYSGNIYVVWASIDSNTYFGIPSFNPNTIRMATSSNQGASFTSPAYVDNSSNANGYNSAVVTNPPMSTAPLHDSAARYAAPQVTISQGNVNGTVSPGQLTIVYDNYGSEAPLDAIDDQTNTVGGASEQFSTGEGSIGAALPINVNITDSKFTTLQDLTITAQIAWPNLSEIDAYVIPPTALNTYLENHVAGYTGEIFLFNEDIGVGTGTADSQANLGATTDSGVFFGLGSGTVFSTQAVRSIEDGTAGKSAVGEYRPDSDSVLLAIQALGLKPNAVGALPGLNGTWTFESDDLVADTSTSPKFVNNAILNFSSGNNPGSSADPEVTIADKTSLVLVPVPGINSTDPAALAGPTENQKSINNVTSTGDSGSGNVTATVQEAPILPAPVIASDNTLGSFSQYEGRLYVAFTGMYSDAAPGNTDILLFVSDDGGKTWSNGLQVNDDNGATDGLSGSGEVVQNGATVAEGRTQYEPQVAVDQSTGTLVVSFLDARNDPSDARVATYIAASNDGGATFAPEVFANPTVTATDAITGNTDSFGPLPDNQSAAGTTQTLVGYGAHQSLAVINGEILPFWSSNQNTAKPLQIVNSILSLTAGPRIISATQGPVGQAGDLVNTSRAADGTPIANTIEVTFDVPVNPTATVSALLANTSVYYKSPNGGTSLSLPVTSVTALNTNALGATVFKISFNPISVLNTYNTYVGTYSYVITPTGISDRIRHSNATGTVVAGNVMDQDANGIPGEAPGANGEVDGDDYVVGEPTGFNSYASATLPLIVPGPNLIGTSAINAAGTVISSGSNNLVLNTTVSALKLTFDRNVQVSSFTAAQILSIFGPAGSVSLNGLTITPLTYYSNGSQVAYAGGGVADTFKVTFATQMLSGTYTVTIGTGIIGADGEAIDPTLNAGLDALRQTATNGVTVPVTYPSTSVPATIPAGSTTTPGMLSAPIVIPDNFPVQGDNATTGVAGLTLTLNINYPVDPNLTAFLVSPPTTAFPNGVEIELFSNVGTGTNTANFSTTTFSDEGSTLISNAGAPFFGTFKPQEPLSNLATQDNLSTLGTWSLLIMNTGSQAGTLNSWSLTFQKPVSSNGLGKNLTSTTFQIFNLDPSSTLASSTWTAVGPTGITPSTSTNSVTYTATPAQTHLAIPGGTVNTPGVLQSAIEIPDNYLIAADTATIPGLVLSLDITQATDSNLIAFLLAPNGTTRINLFTNVGGSGSNFTGTTLSDLAGTSIDAGTAPFAIGEFAPENSFNTLSTAGLSSQGTWQLVIENTGAASGLLNSWSLTFQKPAATLSGTLSTVVVDPSDKTGNTVYVGSASGGVWKTTDFLTTSPAGPTYQPLTDFGPNFSLDIGSIAAFGVNSNPAQTVLFAGTGFGQETTTSTSGYPNVGLNSGAGVGILKSTDGGQTWTLLDSLNNTLPDSQRDHTFVGTTTYKIVVDPKPELNGDIIVYAALGGPNGGLYRSLDSGETWSLLSGSIGGPATDILLDPNSASPTTGNLQILDAAFPNHGVYQSSNQGQTLQLLNGQLGQDPLIVTSGFPAAPLAVNQSPTPSGASSDIVLARPALTNSVSENIDYQGWLFAAVENTNGTFNGLYVTKDDGENWTKVQLPNTPGNGPIVAAVPGNETLNGGSYDPTSSNFSQQGSYDLTLTVDPTNPNIVYLGGSGDFEESGLIRVNLTDMFDSENFTSFSAEQSDGGLIQTAGDGGVAVTNPANGAALYIPSGGGNPESNLLNLRYAPNNGTPGVSPFATNSTLVTSNANNVIGFYNTGFGVTWTPFDETLKANAGDATGSDNLHDAIAYVDPISGDVRMLFADDEGIYTALVNPDGTINDGNGTYAQANYSRNGNLQDEQFFYGAAQPSSAASQAAGALFYASGQTTVAAQSSSTILSTGNLTYDNTAVLNPSSTSPRNTAANSAISTNDRSGVGIATDPSGNGTVDEFDVPILGGNLTDFFRVNQNGQTTGLANNVNAEYPRSGNRVSGTTGDDLAGAAANGQIVSGNFTVNSLNGNQILIASATNNLYETTNGGIQWLPIGNNGNFDGTPLTALAYGAPDPNAPQGVGNLDNFIYAGTAGSVGGSQGHIYVTRGGGDTWTDISSGLDGASVIGIYPDPNRGSHAAYAVTLTGVFYSSDTIGLSQSGQTVWTSITSNLTSIQKTPFGDSQFAESVLAGFNSNNGGSSVGTTQYGGFTSIVADYRYLIPAAGNTPGGSNNVFYPVLYVSGYGGVFDSIDNGATWSVFPNTTFNNAPVDGGYLPNVDVTSLSLILGDINPDTGHAVQTTGDPEILLATTYGRGNFAISLAPDVFPSTLALDTTLPTPNGSDSGVVRGFPGVTNVLNPYIDGVSEVTNYGNTVTIAIYDQSNGILIGTGTTNAFGQFTVQILAQKTNPTGAYYDPTFLNDGTKTIGIQATDSAGAKGNVAIFSYILKATPPANPTNPILTNDSGRFSNDDVTKLVPPTFTVKTLEPSTSEVELVRVPYGSPANATDYEVVDTVAADAPSANVAGTVTLTDTLLASELAGATIDSSLTYYFIQVDEADNFSTPLANITSANTTHLSVFLDDVTPPPPTAITLDPSANSGTNPGSNITNDTKPLFDVTGLLTSGPVAPYNLELFRSSNGSAPVLVATAAPGVTQIQDTLGVPGNGVYVYYAAQVDLAGNVSSVTAPGTPSVTVTINTTAPAIPTLALDPPDDTGAPSHPNVTSVNTPRFIGNGTAGLPIVLVNTANNQVLTTAVTVSANGTYLTQITTPLADGTYVLVAKTTNSAGNSSLSAPLTITIMNAAPSIVPTLALVAASDTGIKGDSVTANHNPQFTGTTNAGDLVTLYSITKGVLSSALATTTASSTNGSFTFQLSQNLTDGTAQLVAQATNVAGKSGPLSSVLTVRIVSDAGDYSGSGASSLSVFSPVTETYAVQNHGVSTVDTTAGRDVPVEFDIDNNGATDFVAYRFNAAEVYGTLIGSGSQVATFFGQPGVSLPVPGYYLGGGGSLLNAVFDPTTATWAIGVPVPGGQVTQFGAAKIDIPVPAAYNGGGITEIATFRPSNVAGGDADSFNVDSASGFYQVSFTSPAVQKLGFVYKAGDIPAPADYDGVGHDEFAVYRPSTGQFFILNTPNVLNSATWTMRTVTLNLPGGPNVFDVPASEDYQGTGKADPTVYRPSNATFYIVNNAGVQTNVPFGTPGVSIAAAGPLLYRLSALKGAYATGDGYTPGVGGLPPNSVTSSGGGTGGGTTGAEPLHIESVASAGTNSTPSSSAPSSPTSPDSAFSTMIAVATPIPITTSAPAPTPASVVVPASGTGVTSGVVIGASTPKLFIPTVTEKAKATHAVKSDKVTVEKAKAPAKTVTLAAKATTLKVDATVEHPKTKTASTVSKSTTTGRQATLAAAAMALQKLVLAKKGKKN